jgi:aspartyl-tRNA(Asn)/glutamyl-tRNA(Gln) amidotransferase subunit A
VRGLRIAFSPNLGYGRNDAQVEAVVRAAATVLADAGAHVEEAEPGFADPIDAFQVLWFAGAARLLQQYGEDAMERVDPGLRRCVERGQGISAAEYLEATAVRADLGERMGRFHQSYDLLITPSVPIVAFEKGRNAPEGWPSADWTSWTPYTYPFNLTQQPAASVPCGLTSSGLPVGLQIVGRRHCDALVLRAAHAYESSTNRATMRPPRYP